MKYIIIFVILACAMAVIAVPMLSSIDTLQPEGLTAKQDVDVVAHQRYKRTHGIHSTSEYHSSKFRNRMLHTPHGYVGRQRTKFDTKIRGAFGRTHHRGYNSQHYSHYGK